MVNLFTLGILGGLGSSEIIFLLLIVAIVIYFVAKKSSKSTISAAGDVVSTPTNAASKIIGIIALIIMIIGLVPFLGWLNWIVIPVAVVGLIIGIFSQNNGGLILCGVVLLAAGLRLFVGGGII